MQDLNVIRYGEMMKMNREGKFERNKFFLTHDKLIYSKTVPVIASETSADDSAGTTAQDTEKTSPDKATDSTGTSQTSRKELDLSTVLVMLVRRRRLYPLLFISTATSTHFPRHCF